MKIKNSDLELERLENLSNLSKEMNRKDLRYKTIYAIFPNVSALSSIPCMSISFKRGNRSLTASESSLLSNFDEYYIITKGNTKDSKISYTEDQKRILVSIFSGVCDEFKLDTAEILCHSLENKELLQSFYSDYGTMRETRSLCVSLLKSKKIACTKGLDNQFPYQYQRPRYSVYELVKDLINDGSSIYTDPDLIGPYKKISRNLEKTSETVNDSWNPIIGKSSNKTRANLNLNYLCKVKVNVPENDLGITAGERELKTIKSICLISDGVVCNTSFGVRIKSKNLVKKLKSARIIKTDLIYDGDYLIDISKLPPISKSRLSNIRSFDLATSEIWYRLSDVAIEYLEKRKYKETSGLRKLPEKIENKKSQNELFLESLGIYGDYFYPDKKVSKVQRVYETTELISKFKALPTKETCSKNITKFINGSKSCNKFVSDFINNEVIPDINKGIPYETLIQVWEKRRNYNRDSIRDLKFRLIAGKSLFVNIHGCHRKSVLNTIQKIKVLGYEISVSWTLKDSHVIV